MEESDVTRSCAVAPMWHCAVTVDRLKEMEAEWKKAMFRVLRGKED